MEGTRNEKVAILIASYVIGFVTAYIAFGVTQLASPDVFAQLSTQNTASVITSTQSEDSAKAVFIAMDKEGLILIKNNQRTLLSATVDSADFLSEGRNVAISDYLLSPDKSKVYFCELPTADSDSCRPYIYVIQEDIVYPVTIEGKRVAFDASGQSVSWSEAGELIIN